MNNSNEGINVASPEIGVKNFAAFFVLAQKKRPLLERSFLEGRWIYFALMRPNMASAKARMSGAAISTLKSMTEAFVNTVKNKVSRTPVPMM
jgi:hypothetical protein